MATAGYSGTPLPKKLGVTTGARVLVVGPAPDGFLGEVDDVTWVRGGRGVVDLAVVFTTSAADFRKRLDAIQRRLAADGAVWFAWPKRSSGVATDMTEAVIRDIAVRRRRSSTTRCARSTTGGRGCGWSCASAIGRRGRCRPARRRVLL